MGKPCKNYPIRDFRPVCNDPDVNFCSAKLMTTYQNETDTYIFVKEEFLKGFEKFTHFTDPIVEYLEYPADYLVCLMTNDKRCKLSDVRCLIC